MGRIFDTYSDVARKKKAKESGSSSYDIETLAKEANIPTKQEPPISFSKLLDWLNAPSEFVEKRLTGGTSYSKRLTESGLPNKPNQIDLNDILSLGGRVALDPLNLVAPLGIGSKVLKGAGAVGKAATKIKPVGVVAKAGADLFKPYAKLKRVSPQLAQELPALETSTRAKQTQVVRRVGKLGKGFTTKTRENIGKLVEKAGAGEKLSEDELLAVERTKKFIQENITDPEITAKIAPNLIADYFPRVAERQAVEKALQFGGKQLSTKLGGFEKQRKYATQIKGEEAGKIYKDALEALATRASRSEAARSNAEFLKRIIKGEIKDINGESIVAPLTKKTGLMPGYQKFSNKWLKRFQAPVEVVDEIEKYFKAFISDDATNILLRVYDKALGLWKYSVTSLFPAFHLRNEIGNLSNMWLGGFKDLSLLKTAAQIQKGKSVTVKGVKITNDFIEQLGIGGKGFYRADLPNMLDESINLSKKGKLKNIYNAPRNVGVLLEDNARVAFFLDRLNKGDTISQAIAGVKKFLFDYSELTPFEKNVMKRLIPFYTWSRKNIPLQIENLIKQPGKAAIFSKLNNLTAPSEEQKAALPEYMNEVITAKITNLDEKEVFKVLTGIGLPFEDLGRLARGSFSRTAEREILGSMGYLGNALGYISNRDYFRNRSISESGYSFGRQAKDYPEPLKKWLEFREEKSKAGNSYYYVNPKKFYVLATLLGRIMRTIGQPNLKEVATAATAPGRIKDISIPEGTAFNKKLREQEIEKRLIEKGKLREFKTTYKPKN